MTVSTVVKVPIVTLFFFRPQVPFPEVIMPPPFTFRGIVVVVVAGGGGMKLLVDDVTWRSPEQCGRFDVDEAVVGQKLSHLHDNVRTEPKIGLEDWSSKV